MTASRISYNRIRMAGPRLLAAYTSSRCQKKAPT